MFKQYESERKKRDVALCTSKEYLLQKI